jgi:hypothetical protein
MAIDRKYFHRKMQHSIAKNKNNFTTLPTILYNKKHSKKRMSLTKAEIFFVIGLLFIGVAILTVVMENILPSIKIITYNPSPNHWQIESIDTMKNSRDLARQDLSDPGYVNDVQRQMSDIAAAGANYVAIDTPYDPEFLPVLQTWVHAARDHGLHIWFRGNFSGWEGWFNYPRIDEQQHLAMTKKFILNNPDLFQDGDIFSSCPECENGANLSTGDEGQVIAYREFLIQEYAVTKNAFAQIHKKVASNFFSMNADVARAVMNRQTTQALDGIVVIDHYVLSPEQLASDTAQISAQSGGSIVLGEFGAPIPNIQGNMTNAQQAQWIDQSMHLLSQDPTLIGVNYWVNLDGSTALWNTNGTAKPAVAVIKKYYE